MKTETGTMKLSFFIHIADFLEITFITNTLLKALPIPSYLYLHWTRKNKLLLVVMPLYLRQKHV